MATTDEDDGDLTDMLGELRVLLPSAQLLSAFLITVPFAPGFASAVAVEKHVFLATFVLSVTALVLFSRRQYSIGLSVPYPTGRNSNASQPGRSSPEPALCRWHWYLPRNWYFRSCSAIPWQTWSPGSSAPFSWHFGGYCPNYGVRADIFNAGYIGVAKRRLCRIDYKI